jgi:hypothetical protein
MLATNRLGGGLFPWGSNSRPAKGRHSPGFHLYFRAQSNPVLMRNGEIRPLSKHGLNVFKNYWGLRLLPGAQSTGSKRCRPAS